MNESTAATGRSGNPLLDISNAIVRLQKKYYGRGPTKARTYISDDLVVVVMRGGFSRAEHTLVERGREQAVSETRLAVQETIQTAYVETIERLTGRTVMSFMSANDPNQELQTEIFVLEHGESAEREASPGHAAGAQAAREDDVEVRENLRALRAEQTQSRSALEQERRERSDR